jgi:uncharacterized membrane protein YqjE
MAISYSPTDHAPAPRISDRLEDLLSAAATYVGARWRLARVEAGQAGGQLARCALAAVGAILLGLFGYGILIFGLIAWVAEQWFEGRMGVPGLIAAGCHLALAVGLGLWLKHLISGGVFFPATRQEFEEDQQWLIQRQKYPC